MTLALLAPTLALARGSAEDPHAGLVLHEGDAYETCYIELHSELDQAAFRQLVGEFGSVGFAPLSSAPTLGRHRVEVGLAWRALDIDDTSDAWNHSWTHPAADHWLGPVRLPVIQLRYGVTDVLDVELMASGDPASNWMLGGMALRAALLRQSDTMPLDLSARLSVVHLFFADELRIGAATAELLAGRSFGPVSPYLGVGVTSTLGSEHSAAVELSREITVNPLGTLGVELALGPARLAVEGVATTRLSSLNVRVGAAF